MRLKSKPRCNPPPVGQEVNLPDKLLTPLWENAGHVVQPVMACAMNDELLLGAPSLSLFRARSTGTVGLATVISTYWEWHDKEYLFVMLWMPPHLHTTEAVFWSEMTATIQG